MSQQNLNNANNYRPALYYGLIAGAIIIGTNTLNFELGLDQVWLGFLVMFIALSFIYVAIKQQRDKTNGGVITFKQGFQTGIVVAVMATCIYVTVWEVYLHKTDFKFVQLYSDSVLQTKVEEGASEQELAATKQQMDEFKQNYGNPVFRLPMTALEIFPVGLLITLISALLLRNHGQQRKNANLE